MRLEKTSDRYPSSRNFYLCFRPTAQWIQGSAVAIKIAVIDQVKNRYRPSLWTAGGLFVEYAGCPPAAQRSAKRQQAPARVALAFQ